jgi:hypothetical protein
MTTSLFVIMSSTQTEIPSKIKRPSNMFFLFAKTNRSTLLHGLQGIKGNKVYQVRSLLPNYFPSDEMVCALLKCEIDVTKRISNSDVSKILGHLWHNYADKELFKSMQLCEAKKHKETYPRYKYKPKTKSNKKELVSLKKIDQLKSLLVKFSETHRPISDVSSSSIDHHTINAKKDCNDFHIHSTSMHPHEDVWFSNIEDPLLNTIDALDNNWHDILCNHEFCGSELHWFNY